jgi:hypothetical protein
MLKKTPNEQQDIHSIVEDYQPQTTDKPMKAYYLNTMGIFNSHNWSVENIYEELKRQEYTKIFEQGACQLFKHPSESYSEKYVALINGTTDDTLRYISFADKATLKNFCQFWLNLAIIGIIHEFLPN